MFEDKNIQGNNTLWVERYRPANLDDYIGNVHLKEKLAAYIESNDVPHLLLYGKAGTGKTSAAKLIAKAVDCDYLFINASDENNVDTMRTKIKNFASSIGFKSIKLVILDEADYLSRVGAQPILRNMMETFSVHCRFILTCNYIEKIIKPLQSRCQLFQIVPPSKKEVAIHVSKILQAEGVKFKPTDLVPIIDSSYPDIRKIINNCQLNSSKGELKVDVKDLIENDYKMKVLDILKSDDTTRNKYMKVRQTIIDSRVTDFTDLFTFLYDKVDEYAADNTANVILALSEGHYRHCMVVDKEIATAACLIEILNLVK